MKRQNKRLFLTLILVLMLGLLTACEDDEDEDRSEPQNAVEAASEMLNRLNDQDVDGASQYLCEQDVQFLRENAPTDATPKYTGVSCAGNESIVTCTYNIEIDGRTAERGLSVEFDVTEDGKLCAISE